MEIEFAGRSDVGRRRRENEDTFLIADIHGHPQIQDSEPTDRSLSSVHAGCTGKLLVIADGLGGHVGGATASALAVRTLADSLQSSIATLGAGGQAHEEELRKIFVAAVERCHDRLLTEQDNHVELRGMGTTLTAAYLVWPQLYILHAGDSRVYLVRDGKLKQLTCDHTLGQKLLDVGSLTAAQLKSSPFRNVLWNCVGGGDHSVVTDLVHVSLRVGDSLLLCSDGLSDLVSSDRIQQLIQASESADDACEALVQEANGAGGTDNVSVIFAHVCSVVKGAVLTPVFVDGAAP